MEATDPQRVPLRLAVQVHIANALTEALRVRRILLHPAGLMDLVQSWKLSKPLRQFPPDERRAVQERLDQLGPRRLAMRLGLRPDQMSR